MKESSSIFRRVAGAAALIASASCVLQAGPISTLFNTGVNTDGTLLEAEQLDPHYTVIASSDETAPGPDAFTLFPGFPVGPWLEEGPVSKWIAPQANQSTGLMPGAYTFSTTFDLTGFDETTAQIIGQMSADNNVTAVRLNGVDLAITSGGFNVWTPFSIPAGSPFQAGENTLEFDVSNAGDAINPIGFRVEMTGRATKPTDPPVVITPPQSQDVNAGDSVTFTVDVDGAPPLSYAWNFNGSPIDGATSATYTIEGATTNNAGRYTVRVTNANGEATSTEAILTVLVPFPGIFNTGVDDNRAVLEDGAVDPHYTLIVNPNDPPAPETFVEDSTLFPIVAGPWLANSDRSKWIGPFSETSTAAGGDYSYELLLNLTGYDPATAFLAGSWATDNAGKLYLNGADTGFTTAGFGTFSTFSLTTGFVSGTNRLEFRVTNEGAGYTGLRVENLRGTAQEATGSQDAPRVVTQPRSSTRVITDNVEFTVVADGAQPLSYQWLKNGQEIQGQTSSTLTLSPVLPGAEGSYSVRVTNSAGSTNSEPAVLTLIQPELGVFNTGVDSSNTALPLGEADPHYVLLTSGDSTFAGPEAYAASGAPIPPWLENDEDSQWITVRPNGVDAIPGNYTYRMIFNLAESEISTAAITASVATDDGNVGVRLNGTAVEFGATAFTAFTDLFIPEGSPFVAGLNTLDFVVNNGGTAANPTGLRVDNIVITGVTVAPNLSVSRTDGTLRVAWPAAAEGFRLQETSSLPGGWTDSTATISVEGNENVATVTIAATGAKFYRLVQ